MRHLIDAGDEGDKRILEAGIPKEKMGYGVVAGDGNFNDLSGLDICTLTGNLNELIMRSRTRPLHFLPAAVLAGIDDARDDILAVGDSCPLYSAACALIRR